MLAQRQTSSPPPPTLEIREKPGSAVKLLVAITLVLVAMTIRFFKDPRFIQTSVTYRLTMIASIAGFAIWVHRRRILRSFKPTGEPALVISPEGLRTHYWPGQLVPWESVEKVALLQKPGQDLQLLISLSRECGINSSEGKLHTGCPDYLLSFSSLNVTSYEIRKALEQHKPVCDSFKQFLDGKKIRIPVYLKAAIAFALATLAFCMVIILARTFWPELYVTMVNVCLVPVANLLAGPFIKN